MTPTESLTDSLIAVLPGKAFAPGDPGYDQFATGWNVAVTHKPVAIVAAETESDVVAAVKWATKNHLPISVQSTGHGPFRRCNGGLLIQTSGLKQIAVSPAEKTATVGAGLMWKDVIAATNPHGLAPINGSSPYVGVVGYTLGGGFGILSREFGLSADHVKAMRVVLASGEVVVASPTENADLFFATLGGGGAFGVVTEMTIGLVDVAEYFGGSVMFDHSLAYEHFPKIVEWMEGLPNNVSAAVHFMTFPPVPFIPEFLHGRSMMIVIGVTTLSESEAAPYFDAIRNLPGAEFDSFRTANYNECGSIYQDPVDPMPIIGQGAMLKSLGASGANAFLDAIGPLDRCPNLLIQLRRTGGKIAENNEQTFALNQVRAAAFLTYFIGVPMGPVSPEMIHGHAQQSFEQLKPYLLGRGPLNWLGEGDVSRERVQGTLSDSGWQKVQSAKAKFDPENQFRFAGIGID